MIYFCRTDPKTVRAFALLAPPGGAFPQCLNDVRSGEISAQALLILRSHSNNSCTYNKVCARNASPLPVHRQDLRATSAKVPHAPEGTYSAF